MREQQIYLLNSANSAKATFQIEYKLRYLTKDDAAKLKIFAIYDCCRVEYNTMRGLVVGRGAGCGSSAEDDSAEDI